MRPVASGSVKSGATSERRADARSGAPCPRAHTWPRALCATGRPRCRHSAATLTRASRTNSRSRPGGTGTQTGPRHSPSGFATQPVPDSKAKYELDAGVRDQAKARAGDLLDRFPLYPGIAV